MAASPNDRISGKFWINLEPPIVLIPHLRLMEHYQMHQSLDWKNPGQQGFGPVPFSVEIPTSRNETERNDTSDSEKVRVSLKPDQNTNFA